MTIQRRQLFRRRATCRNNISALLRKLFLQNDFEYCRLQRNGMAMHRSGHDEEHALPATPATGAPADNVLHLFVSIVSSVAISACIYFTRSSLSLSPLHPIPPSISTTDGNDCYQGRGKTPPSGQRCIPSLEIAKAQQSKRQRMARRCSLMPQLVWRLSTKTFGPSRPVKHLAHQVGCFRSHSNATAWYRAALNRPYIAKAFS